MSAACSALDCSHSITACLYFTIDLLLRNTHTAAAESKYSPTNVKYDSSFEHLYASGTTYLNLNSVPGFIYLFYLKRYKSFINTPEIKLAIDSKQFPTNRYTT